MDYKTVENRPVCGFWQNWSGLVLKTYRFSVKTEANYYSKNGFRSVSLVYRLVFVGFENQYCSVFSILGYNWFLKLILLFFFTSEEQESCWRGRTAG
jgi:hypothetical protein